MPNSIHAQTSALEHAVLTLLGEQLQDSDDEPTDPGTPLDTPEQTQASSRPKQKRRAVAFPFAARRAANELPWTALIEGLTP